MKTFKYDEHYIKLNEHKMRCWAAALVEVRRLDGLGGTSGSHVFNRHTHRVELINETKRIKKGKIPTSGEIRACGKRLGTYEGVISYVIAVADCARHERRLREGLAEEE